MTAQVVKFFFRGLEGCRVNDQDSESAITRNRRALVRIAVRRGWTTEGFVEG
jgi:hypothetical protein